MDHLILALATWRLASLFAKEDGPWDIFVKIRTYLGVEWDVKSEPFGTTFLSKLIVCVWCNSVWFGAFWAIGYFVWPQITWVALPFALSAAAVIFESVVGESYDHR